MAYLEPKENEWVQPVAKDYRMRCCDCGLVHNLDFRVVIRDGEFAIPNDSMKVQFRVRRNNRATAGSRAARKRAWRNKTAQGVDRFLGEILNYE